MATTVTIKGIKNLEDGVLKMLNDTVADAQTLKEVGDQAVKWIQGNARLGSDGYDVPDVSKSWAKERATLAESNPVDRQYKGSYASAKNRRTKSAPTGFKTASNLTLTGQFLASLTFTAANNSVSLFFDGVHKPYVGKSGKAIGSEISNDTLAQYLKEKGRFVLKLSDRLKPILENIVTRNIRRRLSLYKTLSKRL